MIELNNIYSPKVDRVVNIFRTLFENIYDLLQNLPDYHPERNLLNEFVKTYSIAYMYISKHVLKIALPEENSGPAMMDQINNLCKSKNRGLFFMIFEEILRNGPKVHPKPYQPLPETHLGKSLRFNITIE